MASCKCRGRSAPFTLSGLLRLYEAVFGERLLPDSFRRAMVPLLTATDLKAAEGPGKPATLYRR